MGNFHLITIPMSHYCEKARWALDRLEIKYKEERHIQMFHYLRSFMVSGGPNVPILIDDGKVIQDSTAILQHLEQYATDENKLYPKDQNLKTEVEKLEDLFDEQLGFDSRRWLYYQMMPKAYQSIFSMAQGVPLIEKILLPLASPFLLLLIKSHPDTRRKDVEAGFLRSQATIEKIDALLADGRPYLVGNHFSAADLTLACMMSPFIVPPQYGIRLPDINGLSQSMRNTINEFRNTLTGKHVLKMYQSERHLSNEQQAVLCNVKAF